MKPSPLDCVHDWTRVGDTSVRCAKCGAVLEMRPAPVEPPLPYAHDNGECRSDCSFCAAEATSGVMDFPTAWAFIREQHSDPKEHDQKCSWVQANGGLLCDCRVLWDEYDRRKALRAPLLGPPLPKRSLVSERGLFFDRAAVREVLREFVAMRNEERARRKKRTPLRIKYGRCFYCLHLVFGESGVCQVRRTCGCDRHFVGRPAEENPPKPSVR